MATRVLTQVSDVLILQTNQSFIIYAVGQLYTNARGI
jgi:hypothetical protein